MSNKETIFDDWRKGFKSGASLANDFGKDLLSKAVYRQETMTWIIPDESYKLCRDKLNKGYDTGMRLGSKAGLDYYFAASEGK